MQTVCGGGVGWGGGGQEGDRGRHATPHYTVITRMILHQDEQLCEPFQCSFCMRQVVIQDSVHESHLFERKVSRSGIKPRSVCLPAERLTTGPTGSYHQSSQDHPMRAADREDISSAWHCQSLYRGKYSRQASSHLAKHAIVSVRTHSFK